MADFAKTNFEEGKGVVSAAFLDAFQDAFLAHKARHAPGGADAILPGDIGALGGATGAIDNAILRADGAGGSSVQASLVTIDDAGNITIVAGINIKKALETDHTCSGIVATLTAAESTALFQAGYINGSGKIALSDADAASTMPVRALATAAINTDATGVYLLRGYARDDSWSWTPGGALYASGTAGSLTQTAPTGTGKIVQILGYAMSATIIHFTPDVTYLELV